MPLDSYWYTGPLLPNGKRPQRSIQIPRAQLVQAARNGIAGGHRNILRELALHRKRGVKMSGPWISELTMRIFCGTLFSGVAPPGGRPGRNRVLDIERLLDDPVLANRIPGQILLNSVVEDAGARTDHGLWSACPSLAISDSPGQSHARGPCPLIRDVALNLVAQTSAQRHIGAQLPIVLNKRGRY